MEEQSIELPDRSLPFNRPRIYFKVPIANIESSIDSKNDDVHPFNHSAGVGLRQPGSLSIIASCSWLSCRVFSSS